MDINALKKRFAELESRNKRGGKATWKPTAEHDVRCLAVPDETVEDLGKEVYFHFNIGKNFKVYCPKNDGNECALCDLTDTLRAWTDADGNDKPEAQRKQEFQLSRKTEAGPKYFVPVIVRKTANADDFEGPFWWEQSPAVYKDLMKICLDEDYNADHPDGGALAILTSVEHGRDVRVKFMKPGEEGNQTSYNKVSVSERKKARPLLADRKQAKELSAKIPSFDDAVKVLTSADVEKILNEAFPGGEITAAEDPDLGSEHGGKAKSQNAEKLTGTKSVDEAMDKLKGLINKQTAQAED